MGHIITKICTLFNEDLLCQKNILIKKTNIPRFEYSGNITNFEVKSENIKRSYSLPNLYKRENNNNNNNNNKNKLQNINLQNYSYQYIVENNISNDILSSS